MTADYTEFFINSGGTISLKSPTIVIVSGYITGPEMGHFAVDVHEVGSPIVNVVNISGSCICTTPIGNQGLPFRQASAGSLYVIDLDFRAAEVAFLHDESQPAINTNILSSDITPIATPVDFRVQIIMSNAGNFSVVITNSGDSQVGLLNTGIALVAGVLYTFDILVHDGDSINFQYSNTGGIIQTLRVQEINASAY